VVGLGYFPNQNIFQISKYISECMISGAFSFLRIKDILYEEQVNGNMPPQAQENWNFKM
jgi:hypothetical protein